MTYPHRGFPPSYRVPESPGSSSMATKSHQIDLVGLLRRHLIEAHGYTDDYFDDTNDPWTAGELRWLHAPYLKTREYREGCKPI